jgi:hypothetical protein
MDVLFQSHLVSSTPKAVNEYRVFIYGDSSVWGTALDYAETLAGQLDRMQLETCTGQVVRVYNLGYPSNSATKDLLLMQYAQRYRPDLNVWLFSMLAFAPERQGIQFVMDNQAAVESLKALHALDLDTAAFELGRRSFWDETLIGRRRDLNLLLRWNASALLSAILETDEPRQLNDASSVLNDQPKADLEYGDLLPPVDLREHLSLQTLEVGNEITQQKILYVSEPIAITSGPHSDISYNSLFPRWAYDQYRTILNELTRAPGWQYLDLWNLASQNEFSNSVFHLTPAGTEKLAREIAPAILAQACR